MAEITRDVRANSPTLGATTPVKDMVRAYEKRVDEVARQHIDSQQTQANLSRLQDKIKRVYEQDPETMAFEKKEKQLLIDTATQFGGHREENVGRITIIIPQNHQALEAAYRSLVKEIGSHIQIIDEPEEHKMEALTWRNTAKNPTELRAHAEHFMGVYADMVDATAKNHQAEACFGPGRCHIIKSEESLRRKVKQEASALLSAEPALTQDQAIERATQEVNDSLRGTIVVDTPYVIRGITEELQQKCHELGWDITVENLWTENFPGGYTGVGAYVLINSKEGDKSVLSEIQIHLRAIYDGTQHCPKEYSHRIYEYYREAYGASSSPSSNVAGLNEMRLARTAPPSTALAASTLVFYAHLSKVER
jgi:hypothetical protein